ncbi:MAG: hypothetical protein U1A77_23565 [Pirellulales bacterium]
MKWCPGLALVLVLAISATANAQGYGSGVRAYVSGYRYQEAESVPPAEGVPAPVPQMRKSVPYEGPAVQGPVVMHDDGYSMGCDSCGSRGMCCRKPLLPLFSSCCARPVGCGCGMADDCCEPSCCSPTLLQRLHCQCQARWSAMSCRVRTFHQNLWGTGCCSTCGESNAWGGGCGCSKLGGEVYQDYGRDPLMPQSVPQPAPHEAPGPVPETDVPGKTTRRYVPSTVVPSAAWKWTPIRSSY